MFGIDWILWIGDESPPIGVPRDLFLLRGLPDATNQRWSIRNHRCSNLLQVNTNNVENVWLKTINETDFCIVDLSVDYRTHYTMAREGDAASTSLGSAVVPGVGVASSYPYSGQFGSPPNDSSSPHSDPTRMVPSGIFASASHVMAGLPQPPRQKGRPRKRKPKEIEALTANIGKN